MRKILTVTVVATACTLLSTAVEATTITFNGLQGLPFQNPFASYTESGFTVATLSSDWKVIPYGIPDTSIIFLNPPFSTGSVEVTHGGDHFSLSSIDLYSSVTPIPYTFTGRLQGNIVFSTSGMVPNTFGNFATVPNPHGSDVIDTLQIALSNPNPIPQFGANPVGLDNIVVNASGTVIPEPSTLALLSVGIGLTVLCVMRRRTISPKPL